jgi:hypothetical protein
MLPSILTVSKFLHSSYCALGRFLADEGSAKVVALFPVLAADFAAPGDAKVQSWQLQPYFLRMTTLLS